MPEEGPLQCGFQEHSGGHARAEHAQDGPENTSRADRGGTGEDQSPSPPAHVTVGRRGTTAREEHGERQERQTDAGPELSTHSLNGQAGGWMGGRVMDSQAD